MLNSFLTLFHNDFRHWCLLFMFEKVGLADPPRNSRKKSDFLKSQIEKWRADPIGLWKERFSSKPPLRKKPNNSPAARGKRALFLARNGLCSRAVGCLESGALVDVDQTSFEKLKEKHPAALHPLCPFVLDDLPPSCSSVTEEVVKKACASFKKGTSNRGLRVSHLLNGLSSGSGADLLRDLTRAINLLIDGRAPLVFAPYLAGASMFGLDKTKQGIFDVRPIASGEILRRLIGKCLCLTHKEAAAKLFQPAGQFGVACPSGSERVIHRVRHEVSELLQHEHKEAMPDQVILKVDLKNAFNKVSRYHVLRLVRSRFPGLARWVHWCYGSGTDPHLWFGSWTLSSKEGVQQGDPLGPLLFSMVIHEIITAIKAECPNLALNLWYLDDGVIMGKHDDVLKALSIIQRIGPELGMDLNLKKNELVKFVDQPDSFPAQCKRHLRNFELLGSPIGDADFSTAYINEFVGERVEHTLAALQGVKDPQAFRYLLCLSVSFCRVVHLLRTVPPQYSREALLNFDTQVRSSFSLGVGVLFDSEDAWTQLSLPISCGGVGLRSAVAHTSGAYIASSSRAAELDGWDVSSIPGWSEVVADFCTRSNISESEFKNLPNQRQSSLSSFVDKHSLKSITDKASPRDRARLLSVSSPGASSWLGVIPSPALRQTLDPRVQHSSRSGQAGKFFSNRLPVPSATHIWTSTVSML